MYVEPFGEPDERPAFDEKADHAFDDLRFLVNRLDELRNGRRLQPGVGETRFDHPRQLAFGAA